MGILALCFGEPSSCFHLAEAQISQRSSLPGTGANFHISACRGGRSRCRAGRRGAAEPRSPALVCREVQHLIRISPAVGNRGSTSSSASLLTRAARAYIKSFLFFPTTFFFFQERKTASLCRAPVFVLKMSMPCSSWVVYEMCRIIQHACLN